MMEFKIITNTKIIEAFKIIHPEGYVRSYPILDEMDILRKGWKKHHQSSTRDSKSCSSTTNNNKSSSSTTSDSKSSSSTSNNNKSSSSTTEIRVEYYPNIYEPSIIYRERTGVIYANINSQIVAIGFDLENDGKIKMPTASQITLLRKDAPLNV